MNLDREIEAVEAAYERGEITNSEMWKEIRELQRDYRAAAEEAARDAYEAELERW